MSTDHERLHQRLWDGTADPGMYPDCAREMGMFDEREPEPTVEQICAASGHEYHGDDGDRGRCYCGERDYAPGGADALSSAHYDGKEDAPMTDETKEREHGDDKPATESDSDGSTRTQVDETATKSTTVEKPADR